MTGTRPSYMVLRTARGHVSLRLRLRGVIACLGLGAAVLVATVAAIAFGSGQYEISPFDALATVFGTGNFDDLYIVNYVRLPRAVAAAGIGIMLGLAGAIFQSLSRNPLGSPEIIGYNDGAATGAVLTLFVLPATAVSTATGSIVGGLATAVVVYMIASPGTGTASARLILIGIGITALLKSFNAYLLNHVALDEAIAAKTWLYGNLNGLTWSSLWPAAFGLAVFVPATFFIARQLSLLEMGDDAAVALGVKVGKARLAFMCVGVGLTGCSIATAGPIAFVALAAPQIGRRVSGVTGPGLLPAALVGPLLLVMSDMAGQRLIAPVQVPVGIVTGVLGGIYLTALLIAQWRKSPLSRCETKPVLVCRAAVSKQLSSSTRYPVR